jgi:hypothetical protein
MMPVMSDQRQQWRGCFGSGGYHRSGNGGGGARRSYHQARKGPEQNRFHSAGPSRDLTALKTVATGRRSRSPWNKMN